jgi:hypothetical protein
MPDAAKPGRATLSGPLSDAPEAAAGPVEASEATARRLSSDPPALDAWLGEDLQSTMPQALEPSGPARRFSADPGNEAADRVWRKSALAGAPSSAPLEFGRPIAAGTSAKLDRIASVSRAAQPHSAKAPEKPQRDPVAPPSATARAAFIGAAGAPAPVGAGGAIRPEARPSRQRHGCPRARRRSPRN